MPVGAVPGCLASNTTTKTSKSESGDVALALELAVRDFWPTVPEGWAEFCLYRELHKDFRIRADAVGPHELTLDASTPDAWNFQQRTNGDGHATTFLVLSQYTGDPFSHPVATCTALKRLKRIRVLGSGAQGTNQIKAALPLLPSLTHVEVENPQDGQNIYHEILGKTVHERLYDGSLHCIIRGAFLSNDASLWLRCLPASAAVASTKEECEEGMSVEARVSIARKLIMGRMFPCEMDAAEACDPLFAAATRSVQWLAYLLRIGFEHDHTAVQRLFQALCEEPHHTPALAVLCSAGASPHDAVALRNALDPSARPALRFLLSQGVDVNVRLGEAGLSIRALHMAAYNADSELISLLLEARADPRVADDFGKLPTDYCAHELQGGIDDAALRALLDARAQELQVEEQR